MRNTELELTNKEVSNHSPMKLMELAIQQGSGVDQLEKLMALQERWNKQQAEKQFYEAFNRFQENKPEVKKNKKVEFKGKLQYEFADLAHIQRIVDPILSSNGLSYSWKQKSGENGSITIECILKHVAGHTESNSLTAHPDKSGSKNDIQAIGSGVSYLKRYTLLNALGLSTGHDDDGVGTGLTREEMLQAERDKLMDILVQYEGKIPPQMYKRAQEIISSNEEPSYSKAITAINTYLKS